MMRVEYFNPSALDYAITRSRHMLIRWCSFLCADLSGPYDSQFVATRLGST